MAKDWNITDSDELESVFIYGSCDPINEEFCINGKCFRMYVKSSGDYYNPICHCDPGYQGRRCQFEIAKWPATHDTETYTSLYLLNIFGIVLAVTVLVLSLGAMIYFVYLKKKIRSHILIYDCNWIRSLVQKCRNIFSSIWESVRSVLKKQQQDVTVVEIECQHEADDTPLTPKTFSDSQLHNRRMSKDYDPAGQEPKKFQRTSDHVVSRERLDYCCERVEV